MSSGTEESQNALKKGCEAPGIMKFFKSLGKTNNDECPDHVKAATFSSLVTAKKEKCPAKARKRPRPRAAARVSRSRQRAKPATRNAKKKPKASRSGEGHDKESVYDIQDISDDAEEMTIIEYSEFLKQQQISKETKTVAEPPSDSQVAAAVPPSVPSPVITSYFRPVSEQQKPESGEGPVSSRPKRACTVLRNAYDSYQEDLFLDTLDRRTRRGIYKVDLLESQHPMRLRNKRDSSEQCVVQHEDETVKSPRFKHKKKKRSKGQSQEAEPLVSLDNSNEVYTSTIIEERSDFKCPRLRITRVSKDHDDAPRDPIEDTDLKDVIVCDPVIPQVDEKRTDFLESGIPEKLRQQLDESNEILRQFAKSSEDFPAVSHIRQMTDDKMWTLPSPEMPNLTVADEGTPPTVTGKLELGSLTDSKSQKCPTSPPPKGFDLQEVLSVMQQEHPKLAVGKIFERYQHQKLLSRISHSGKEEVNAVVAVNDKDKGPTRGKRARKGAAKRNSKANAVTGNDINNQHPTDLCGNSTAADESALMWTDKFQPQGASDVIGNERAVQELRSWLHHWKRKPRPEESSGRTTKRKRADSATDDDYLLDEVCPAKLLVGPPGIGKTATVYALANEIGFEVIEVNASSKRNGKQVLNQLQEATQSHNVNNSPASQTSGGIASYFQKSNNRSGNSQKLDKNNLKKKCSTGSLILFKDVDIVLEEDEGFINAVNTFIEISKRPIVLTTSDNHFTFANRLTAIHEELRFDIPNWDLVILHVQLMSLAEGLHVPTEEMLTAIPPWKIDIRHAILTLQYRTASTVRHPVAEAAVNSEIVGNASRRRKRQNKAQPTVPPPLDASRERGTQDLWQLPCGATEQLGRILTLTTDKFVTNDKTIGVCWSNGINFALAPSKPVLEHRDGTNNTLPGESNTGATIPSSSLMSLSEFVDSLSAADVIQWQVSSRVDEEPELYGSREFVRPGCSDVFPPGNRDNWCGNTCWRDIGESVSTLNWENFSKKQQEPEERSSVCAQWTKDTVQPQISKARKDVKSVLKQCSPRALDLDYLPWLKVICRAEGIRHVSNKKRGGGRYLHYLDSINLSLQPGTLSHLTNS